MDAGNRQDGGGAKRPRRDVIEKLLAGVALAICAGMLVRMLIGEHRRARLDGWLRRVWLGLRARVIAVWRWRSVRKEAERVAEDAIRRARDGVQRDGNVYRPKSFKRPPRDKMH